MSFQYKAPLQDIRFIRNTVFDFTSHYAACGFDELGEDTCDAIFQEIARFAEQEVAPLNRSGDEQGCALNDGQVSTPDGFKEAYQRYVNGGWPGLSAPEEFGGQGLPPSLSLLVAEILSQANQSWSMYTGLSAGARSTILAHGSDTQQRTYLPHLVSGNWTGTMCLTEPQCGSDLSFLRTRALPQADGSYQITGTKIFISSGDHDMAENIVHIVLARLPNAPEGTRGISLFIVPKFIPTADGQPGERNALSAGALEKKMGIHGNATCVMNFDGATGYLIGEENKGLNCMFTFMNAARVGTAIQGITHAEIAQQGAWRYAVDREAGRALSGAQFPDRPADPLIVHPDVRRMLFTIRAFAEGNRAFSCYLQKFIDLAELASDAATRDHAETMLSFLTPIAKGFMTENGVESASSAMQVFGGHGYIREWGMEQNYRDARISTLYEGTTGIQALDLLGRKVLGSKGKTFAVFYETVLADIQALNNDSVRKELNSRLDEWAKLTAAIGEATANGLDEVGAAAHDYLMYSGYIVLAIMWARMADAAAKAEQTPFHRLKLTTANFYMERILPRADFHAAQIGCGAATLMDLSNDEMMAAAE